MNSPHSRPPLSGENDSERHFATRLRQNRTGRLRAPQENGAILVAPPWRQLRELISENLALRGLSDYDFQGRSLSTLINQARGELLVAARRWTSAYRDISFLSEDSAELIFLAGHQPQMFHPGVFCKNFALDRLAKSKRATAINLIIDSDVITSASLRVPGGSITKPRVSEVAFDRVEPKIPFEERVIEDRSMFESFALRVGEQIAPLVPHPLLEKYWPIVLGQSKQQQRMGDCLARARHILETHWGSHTLEIPQSWICEQEAFHWLVAHLTARLRSFLKIYNEAIREYRRLRRIRSLSHPVPDLTIDNEWLEAPFWIWSQEDPRRRPLFVKHGHNETVLSDRETILARLPLGEDGDAAGAVERLMELRRSGVKIRSRALATTLWARLALGHLFL
ncbi:MAG: hypothetical protein ACWGMZ_12395, partial [Thermoguttaceae bacterium]